MKKFGLIGYPLGHSLSAVIHKAGFKSLGIDASYEILETDPEDLVDRVKFFKHNDYSGFNITIPLKLPIALFTQEVYKYADIAGAVNTIRINDDKTFSGFNTDAMGFKKAIPSDIDLEDATVALLGTGGASRAAVLALSECKVKEIGVYTRNIPNAMDYMAYIRRKFPEITFNVYQIEQVRDLSKYQMLVNTTPIGMRSKAMGLSPIDEEVIKTMNKDSAIYDIVYNPLKTELIKLAKKHGIKTIQGLDMLIYQGAKAFEIWTGKKPDTLKMKLAALEEMVE